MLNFTHSCLTLSVCLSALYLSPLLLISLSIYFFLFFSSLSQHSLSLSFHFTLFFISLYVSFNVSFSLIFFSIKKILSITLALALSLFLLYFCTFLSFSPITYSLYLFLPISVSGLFLSAYPSQSLIQPIFLSL